MSYSTFKISNNTIIVCTADLAYVTRFVINTSHVHFYSFFFYNGHSPNYAYYNDRISLCKELLKKAKLGENRYTNVVNARYASPVQRVIEK